MQVPSMNYFQKKAKTHLSLSTMATFFKLLSFFFLIMAFSCYQIQARESKFFSKYPHLKATNHLTIPNTNPFSSPTPSPAPTSQISSTPTLAPVGTGADDFAPAPSPTTFGDNIIPSSAPTTIGADYGPAPAPYENESDTPYYGLYAKDNNDEEFNNGETYTYNNGYSDSLSNNNAFWTPNDKGYHNTDKGYDFDNGYKSEPQGMSDTRLQSNGKYYYDTESGNGSPGGLENNEEGYYYSKDKKSKYEFDSMEEYEKQEGIADVDQDFNP